MNGRVRLENGIGNRNGYGRTCIDRAARGETICSVIAFERSMIDIQTAAGTGNGNSATTTRRIVFEITSSNVESGIIGLV